MSLKNVTGESSGTSMDFVNLEGFFFLSPCLGTQNSDASASSDNVEQSCEQVPVSVPVYSVVISYVQQMEPLQV